MTRVLFLTHPHEDYLADSLLHGLKSLEHVEVIDYPKADLLYKKNRGRFNITGKGFSLYYLLDDVNLSRYDAFNAVKYANYEKFNGVQTKIDLVIISNIHRQFGFFIQLLPYLKFEKTAIIDGDDVDSLYPYHGNYWRNRYFRYLPKAHDKFRYYKREWTSETIQYLYYKLIPKNFSRFFSPPKHLRTISFSFPQEKIIEILPDKKKMFPKHIVDAEIAAQVEGSFTTYAFEDEQAYYEDLQSSKYGITTKRSGWDCLRHYEIAANAAVPCFKNLHLKPETCAPHGLDDTNSITYKNYDDLMRQIDSIDDARYRTLQEGALRWVKNNTTVVRAKKLLKEFNL